MKHSKNQDKAFGYDYQGHQAAIYGSAAIVDRLQIRAYYRHLPSYSAAIAAIKVVQLPGYSLDSDIVEGISWVFHLRGKRL